MIRLSSPEICPEPGRRNTVPGDESWCHHGNPWYSYSETLFLKLDDPVSPDPSLQRLLNRSRLPIRSFTFPSLVSSGLHVSLVLQVSYSQGWTSWCLNVSTVDGPLRSPFSSMTVWLVGVSYHLTSPCVLPVSVSVLKQILTCLHLSFGFVSTVVFVSSKRFWNLPYSWTWTILRLIVRVWGLSDVYR